MEHSFCELLSLQSPGSIVDCCVFQQCTPLLVLDGDYFVIVSVCIDVTYSIGSGSTLDEFG